jgi:hypothetical protein
MERVDALGSRRMSDKALAAACGVVDHSHVSSAISQIAEQRRETGRTTGKCEIAGHNFLEAWPRLPQ